jgi:hypothetical protein
MKTPYIFPSKIMTIALCQFPTIKNRAVLLRANTPWLTTINYFSDLISSSVQSAVRIRPPHHAASHSITGTAHKVGACRVGDDNHTGPPLAAEVDRISDLCIVMKTRDGVNRIV